MRASESTLFTKDGQLNIGLSVEFYNFQPTDRVCLNCFETATKNNLKPASESAIGGEIWIGAVNMDLSTFLLLFSWPSPKYF